MNTFTLPAHAGLNADWSSRAWLVGRTGEVETWLVEDEDAGCFELVTRVWDDFRGEADIRVLAGGLSEQAAFELVR